MKKMKYERAGFNAKRLPREVILSAAAGEPDALRQVLDFYDPYLNAVASECVRGTNGMRDELNEDKKSFLTACLIAAVLKWRA